MASILRQAYQAGANRSAIAELSKARNRARRGAGGGAGIYATGIEEVDKALANLPRSLQAKGARKGTRAAAKVVLDLAMALVPVRTGELERSLKVRAMKRSRVAAKKFDVGHQVLTGEGFFTGDQFYGGFMEFGTKPRQTGSGAYRGQIDPTRFAFLRPAIYSDRSKKFAVYLHEVQKWLREQGHASKVAEKILD